MNPSSTVPVARRVRRGLARALVLAATPAILLGATVLAPATASAITNATNAAGPNGPCATISGNPSEGTPECPTKPNRPTKPNDTRGAGSQVMKKPAKPTTAPESPMYEGPNALR